MPESGPKEPRVARMRRKQSAGKGARLWQLQWLEKSWRLTIVAN